jgi:Zn-dependent M28 family amino/carboxypeptidase
MVNPLKRWVWACGVVVLGLVLVVTGQDVPKSAVIDSAQLLNDLRVLSADAMQGREPGTPGGDKARGYIVDRFKASGLVPFGASYEQPFTFTARGSSTARRGVNVVGRIDGTRESRRYIVITAHYDHLGIRNGVVFNGADDNASGTAALFAIAKYFTARRPTNSLIFAAFDAEEGGLHGSQAFVKQPPVEAKSLMLNLNADMIGRASDDRLFVVGTALQPFLKPHVEAVARKAPVKLLMGHEDPRQPREDWTRDSDHYSFMQAKIPALYIGVEDYAQHHKATDDYETMSHAFYVRAVEALIQMVEQFDANLDAVERAKP